MYGKGNTEPQSIHDHLDLSTSQGRRSVGEGISLGVGRLRPTIEKSDFPLLDPSQYHFLSFLSYLYAKLYREGEANTLDARVTLQQRINTPLSKRIDIACKHYLNSSPPSAVSTL